MLLNQLEIMKGSVMSLMYIFLHLSPEILYITASKLAYWPIYRLDLTLNSKGLLLNNNLIIAPFVSSFFIEALYKL